jgi:hypothetical protein
VVDLIQWSILGDGSAAVSLSDSMGVVLSVSDPPFINVSDSTSFDPPVPSTRRMISIFSDAVRLTCRPPRQDPSDFFEHAVLESELGQLLLASPLEVLAPSVVEVGRDAFPAASLVIMSPPRRTISIHHMHPKAPL